MDFSPVKEALAARGFSVSVFSSSADAAAYLNAQIDGSSVSFGGSMTLEEMGLFESLAAHNSIYSHWHVPAGADAAEIQRAAQQSEHYLLSANALAATGELINIDGTGNRLSSMLFGHKKVWYVVGRNKLAPDFDAALWRARNVAAPKNAARLGMKTPCTADGRCHDCKSPQRICRGLVVLWEAVKSCESEVVLIDEELGY